MNKVRTILLTLVFGGIIFLFMFAEVDFSFYDAQTYEEMEEFIGILEDDLRPYKEEELQELGITKIRNYKYTYSNSQDVVTIEVYGEKLEHIIFEFTGDMEKQIFYERQEYGFIFFLTVIVFILIIGIVPAIVIEKVILKIVKRKKN